MKVKFLVAAAALLVTTAPVLASTPSGNPFDTFSNDQANPSAPAAGDGDKDSYISPFGDHLRQSRTEDDMRPTDSRGRNNLLPPRMDAGGVPDPRI